MELRVSVVFSSIRLKKMNSTALGSEAYLKTFALWGSKVYLVIFLISLVSTPMCVPFFNTTLDSYRLLC